MDPARQVRAGSHSKPMRVALTLPALVRWCGCLISVMMVAGGGAGCAPRSDPDTYQGYVEAEYLYLASPRDGQLKELSVERGEVVEPGVVVFRLDEEPDQTLRLQAEQNLNRARAQLADLRKGLRPSELAALEARQRRATAALELAEKEFERVEQLVRQSVASLEDLDRVRATRDLSAAQVAEGTADLETARLGARVDEIQAAEAAVAAAQAGLAAAEWNVAQRAQATPVGGIVHDTLYRPGEWVRAGGPVVVLLPPDRLKVRFFVPQAGLSRLGAGGGVLIGWDGSSAPQKARISYISTKAEFTPPVIYSQQTRAKLVFMVEARFDSNVAGMLHPGQPVDVRLSE